MSYSVPEFGVVPTVVTTGAASSSMATTEEGYRHVDSPSSSKGSPSSRRRGGVNRLPPNVDPCLIAPLKKRRIDENLLPGSERDKLLMKRMKNRDAAAKCRQKKKQSTEKLRTEHSGVADDNKKIETDIRSLLKEKETLEKLLREHHCVRQAKAKA